jgi:two-component system chemotaxis response regulator CheB
VPALVCVEQAQLQAALGAGALDGYPRSPEGVAQLAQRVRALQTRAQLTAAASLRPSRPSQPISQRASAAHGCKLIAIGASTGGTEAISFLLSRLPLALPGIVIVQHMPGSHTGVFAERLNEESDFRVCEARDGARVEPGTVLIAPGGSHARVTLQGGAFCVVLSAAPPPEPAERIRRADQRHVPSVDVLFESVARTLGGAALGILLTGMGDDGAAGLLSLRRSGAHTFAQDEASCVVYGMPRRAVELDAASEIVDLQDMPERIAARCL